MFTEMSPANYTGKNGSTGAPRLTSASNKFMTTIVLAVFNADVSWVI